MGLLTLPDSTARIATVGSILLAYMLVFVHRVSPSVLVGPMAKSLGLATSEFGFWSSLYFYAYAAAQFFVGPLVDTLGPYIVVIVSQCLAVLGSIVTAIGTNLLVASIGRLMVGFGVAFTFVPGLKLFSNWFPPHVFTRMSTVLCVTGSVGGLLATTPLVLLVDWIGWRGSFWVIAILTSLAIIIFCVLASDGPRETIEIEEVDIEASMTEITVEAVATADSATDTEAEDADPVSDEDPNELLDVEDADIIETSQTDNEQSQEDADEECEDEKEKTTMGVWETSKAMLSLLKKPVFLILPAYQMVGAGAYLLQVGLLLSPFLQDTAGLSLDDASFIIAGLNICIIYGTPLCTLLSELPFTGINRVLSWGGVVAFCLSVPLALLSGTSLAVYAWVFVLVQPIFSNASVPLVFTAAKHFSPPGLEGCGIALCNFGVFLGAAIWQLIFGWLPDMIGTGVETESGRTSYSVDTWHTIMWLYLIFPAAQSFFGFIMPHVPMVKKDDDPEDPTNDNELKDVV